MPNLGRNYWRSPVQGYDVLGHYLDLWFGDAYGAIGFTFNSGELGAYGSDGFEQVRFDRAPAPSLTATLGSRGAPFLVLDLDETLARDSSQTSAFRNEIEVRRDVGESFSDDVPRMWSLQMEGIYDALVYFDVSHTPTTLDWIR